MFTIWVPQRILKTINIVFEENSIQCLSKEVFVFSSLTPLKAFPSRRTFCTRQRSRTRAFCACAFAQPVCAARLGRPWTHCACAELVDNACPEIRRLRSSVADGLEWKLRAWRLIDTRYRSRSERKLQASGGTVRFTAGFRSGFELSSWPFSERLTSSL